MAKLKSPLLSLDAAGTVADAITFARRHQTNIVRRKPALPYQRTLPQNYQRWLYQDYIAWWHTLSPSQQSQWKSDASHHNMPGFAYFLKTRLTLRDDIAANWHLDEKAGIIARDVSPNLNHGTIFGASHITGIIDHALFFDGINDRVDFDNDASLFPTPISIIVYLNPYTLAYRQILDATQATDGHALLLRADGNLRWRLGDGTNFFTLTTTDLSIPTYTFSTIIATLDGTTMKIYLNDVQSADTLNFPGIITITEIQPLTIGNLNNLPHDMGFHGIIDETIILNRTLYLPDAQRHSERRYPL